MVQSTRPHLALGVLPTTPLVGLRTGEQLQEPDTMDLWLSTTRDIRPQSLAQRRPGRSGVSKSERLACPSARLPALDVVPVRGRPHTESSASTWSSQGWNAPAE